MSSYQIVMEYIQCNERKHLAQECYEYDDFNKWYAYAKEHIYYHMLVVIQGVLQADQEMINIWKEYGCEEEEEEEEDTSSICKKCGCCLYDIIMPEKWRIELTGKAEFCSCE